MGEEDPPRRRGGDPRGRALLRELFAILGDLPDPPDPVSRGPLEGGRVPPPEPIGRAAEQLAQALADAFVAGEWTAAGLIERGTAVLGRRRAWLRTVSSAVLSAYRDCPADRPRELGRYIAALPQYGTVVAVARANRVRLRVAARSPVPVRTVRQRWPVPRIDDLGALAAFTHLDAADLDWFADRRGLARRAPAEALRNYRYRWAPTRSGGFRLLEAPKERLKGVQRRLLAGVVALIPPHGAAHAFRPGRSALTFAAPHAGRDLVIRLDLEGFFATVTAGRVYGVFRAAGYPEPVAHALTGLCTAAAPVGVLSRAPRPADPARRDAHRRLLARLAVPHLPQGAPASPALASLCAYRLDVRLAGLAGSLGCTYTRYADDLAFSGDRGLATSTLIAAVTEIATDEGFRVNRAKTASMTSADRQQLAGLVVNNRPAVRRRDYDDLRAILHNAAHTGPAAQNRDGHPDFRAHLLGRISWVRQTSAARGARLLEAFQRIEW